MEPRDKILGIEGGGTKTAWVLVAREGTDFRIVEEGKLPPSNFRLATPEQLRSIFSQLPKEVDRVGAGVHPQPLHVHGEDALVHVSGRRIHLDLVADAAQERVVH